ncbi:hypothetical protein [Moraxella catarrhalis]|uniref:hypothetical protein n=1 Tax=Moraxella catarrhalis TaxID=480 RepID=UPI0007E32342|nr:hypothetical protein [Moraxella catarrhalis]OAV33276.1 hypothetical protein AO368_0181 [Moraxella catarrhalis]
MLGIVSPNKFPHFKNFKCEKCGKVYKKKDSGIAGLALLDLLSETVNGITTKGLCDDCGGFNKKLNFENILKY